MPTIKPADRQLASVRRRIDSLDRRIVRLLQERASLAVATIRIKKALSQPLRDPAREEEVLSLVRRAVRGPLKAKALGRIYLVVMGEMRKVERATFPPSPARSSGAPPRRGRR